MTGKTPTKETSKPMDIGVLAQHLAGKRHNHAVRQFITGQKIKEQRRGTQVLQEKEKALFMSTVLNKTMSQDIIFCMSEQEGPWPFDAEQEIITEEKDKREETIIAEEESKSWQLFLVKTKKRKNKRSKASIVSVEEDIPRAREPLAPPP